MDYLESTYAAHCEAVAFWKKMEQDLRRKNEAQIAKWKLRETELKNYSQHEIHMAIQQMRIDRIKELLNQNK